MKSAPPMKSGAPPPMKNPEEKKLELNIM